MDQQAPPIDELKARIHALFRPDPPARSVEVPPADSPYCLAPTIGDFEVVIPEHVRQSAASDDQDPADAWLDTPSAVFGGDCPRDFLNGNDTKRTFLYGIVCSIEDGAFS